MPPAAAGLPQTLHSCSRPEAQPHLSSENRAVAAICFRVEFSRCSFFKQTHLNRVPA
ncbi:rCG59298 [Rattus norvegicus]|uniref:RCG59298 n=1 Tax=Rattus norvegicus TaxID=10116 RepID=A6K7T9_RAT|nr:rCG59298 [Rattus norvegicus]